MAPKRSEIQVLVRLWMTLIYDRLLIDCKKMSRENYDFEVNGMLVGGRRHLQSFYRGPVSVNVRVKRGNFNSQEKQLGVEHFVQNGVREGHPTPVRISNIRQGTVFHIVITRAVEVRATPGQE